MHEREMSNKLRSMIKFNYFISSSAIKYNNQQLYIYYKIIKSFVNIYFCVHAEAHVQAELPLEVEIKTMNKPSPNSLSHGSISVIGRRRSMEDAVTVAPGVIRLEGDRPTLSYDFYAVYDGNGAVAWKCKERLHHVVAEQVLDFGLDEWDRVMSSSFARVDEEFVKDEFGGITSLTDLEELVGSTASVVLVGLEEIVVANCGDSKAVLSCNGAAVTLSRDTKKNTG
ncbi:unnamed protein product [Amaranthus hypochondriacus]